MEQRNSNVRFDETWEEFCEKTKDLPPEERQEAFKQYALGNPVARKVIGDNPSPDRNASYMGALAVFFGVFGIHDLNCGNIRNGVLKLIFTLTGPLFLVSFIWTVQDLFKFSNGTYKAANGIPIGAAPWCKIAAIVEIVLLSALAAFVIGFFVFLETA